MPINDNSMNLAKYRGEVKPCPLCTNRPPNAALDAMLSGKACRLCKGHGFVAMCTNCNGTGIYQGTTVWDGGLNPHQSTCNPCGGAGVFAVRKPADWTGDLTPVATHS